MKIIFTTDSIKFANGEIEIKEYVEPYLLIKFTDALREVEIPVKNTQIHGIDEFSFEISITDTSEYFYDHQNMLRKKVTVRFTNKSDNEEFSGEYKKMRKKVNVFKYYANGTLKSRGNENDYEEYYNMPGYFLKFKGELDEEDNYSNGTFYNKRSNIQIDFGEIENNIPKGTYSIFFYDEEGEEVNYHEATVDFNINVATMDVDKFAELMLPDFNDIILRTETVEDLLYRTLKEISSLKEEVRLAREVPKKSGWFY